eukprot:SAG11_NODE_6863_length_1234_cov_1.082819_1_plen_103_part_00
MGPFVFFDLLLGDGSYLNQMRSQISDTVAFRVELGINFDNIKNKTFGVLTVLTKGSAGIRQDATVIEEADLVGPLLFCLALGGGLLLVRRQTNGKMTRMPVK